MTFASKAALVGLILALGAPLAANAQATGDPAKGRLLVKERCGDCHSLVVDRGPRPAPSMKGLAGRKAATVATFKYSPALKRSNIVWTQDKLYKFLAAPNKMVPGTFMEISIPNPTERAHVVAYLATLN